MPENINRVPWIGRVHVRPLPGKASLGAGAKGAYANILALAHNESEFRDLVALEMKLDDLYVEGIEDIATVEDYKAEGRIAGEVANLLVSLSEEWPIQYKTFNRYFSDDS